MRGQQLSDLYAHHVADRQVGFAPMEFSQPRHSIVILTKAAGLTAERRFLNRLKDRDNLIVFDPVDGKLPSLADEYADLVLAASLAGLDAARRAHPGLRTELVLHHVDPRIEAMHVMPAEAFTVRYFGELFNTLITPILRRRVEYVQVTTRRPSSAWLKRLPGTALHFAIRKSIEADWVKPFTKGFVAAHTSSAILVHESETEAVRWLGPDYPFLVRGDADESAVLRALDYAADMYGTAAFGQAKARVNSLRDPSSGAVVARQLAAVLRLLD